jgi:endothelin-converting enzyme
MSARDTITVRQTVDETNFDMMKNLYESCMNQTELNKLGAAPLVSLLEEFSKIFPLDDESYTSNATVSEADTKIIGDAMIWMGNLGIYTIESLGSGADDKNPVRVLASWLLTMISNRTRTSPERDHCLDQPSVVAKPSLK